MRLAAFLPVYTAAEVESVLPQPVFCMGACPEPGLETPLQALYVPSWSVGEGSDPLPVWAHDCFVLPEALQTWGVTQIEQAYSEDLVYGMQVPEQTAERYTVPVQFVPRAYTATQHLPVFAELSALFSYLRQHFTVDCFAVWGHSASGYFPIALYALGLSGVFSDHFVPVYDLQCIQPYRHLSAQLLEAAGIEWVLRSLPESLTDGFEDPRPLVMLAAQPYFRLAVSHHVFQNLSSNSLVLSEAKTRAVWETFLIPHQQVTGYLAQWQEILYRSLPGFCQASHLLALQAKKLDEKELLTPFFQRSVTPQGHIQQDSAGLRESAQLIQARQPQKMSAQHLLRVPELQRRWQLFLNDHGHWGSLDLSQPRLHEGVQDFVQSLLLSWHTGNFQEELSWSQRMGAGLWWKKFQALYSARENFWSNTLWALDQVKRRIQEKHISADLPWGEHFWDYPPDLLVAEELLPGHSVTALAELPKPALRGRTVASLQGMGLKTGMAQGRLWMPAQAPGALACLPEDWSPQETLLYLPCLQVQHWPWVAQVAGVILGQGHVFDQGSHLLREWNKPAVIQVGQVEQLEEGAWLRLDSARGRLDVLEPEP